MTTTVLPTAGRAAIAGHDRIRVREVPIIYLIA